MLVCAHGNVTEFCKERDMVICDVWAGEVSEYRGDCRVLVTDSEMSEHEYYFLKGELLGRGIELISTRYKDDKLLSEFLVYSSARRRGKSTGRKRFGDEKVVQRIMELHRAGLTLRGIQADKEVCYSDGGKPCISTISGIIKRETKNGK